jgi:hypothetical protein
MSVLVDHVPLFITAREGKEGAHSSVSIFMNIVTLTVLDFI